MRELQQRFAKAITAPLGTEHSDAGEYICASPTLQPSERLQIYNEQYWWRLFGALADALPTVVRLFGKEDFDQEIAQPFLLRHPPSHWSLYPIADGILEWMEGQEEVVLDCARLDLLIYSTFFCPVFPPSVKEQFQLQPHVRLYESDCDYLTFREELLAQSADYWLDNDFPELKKEKTYGVIFRNVSPDWAKVDADLFALLKRFEKPTALEEVVEDERVGEWFRFIGERKILM